MIQGLARSLVVCICWVISIESIRAQESGDQISGWSVSSWIITTSIYTRHFDPEPYHNNDQNLISVEALFNNGWTAGAAVFDNSYDQDSQLIFMGRTWNITNSNAWYFTLRGGLLHGYKEPYDDKIPLNGLGIAPVILPALGFRYRNLVSELNLAGTAAMTLTVGFQF